MERPNSIVILGVLNLLAALTCGGCMSLGALGGLVYISEGDAVLGILRLLVGLGAMLSFLCIGIGSIGLFMSRPWGKTLCLVASYLLVPVLMSNVAVGAIFEWGEMAQGLEAGAETAGFYAGLGCTALGVFIVPVLNVIILNGMAVKDYFRAQS